MPPEIPIPLAIHRGERDITVTWAADHRSVFPARDLRIACPCAQCRDEFTGRLLLEPGAVPETLAAGKIELVGTYAIRIDWSDGHRTGIYTYEYLREICPCEKCDGSAGRRAGGG